MFRILKCYPFSDDRIRLVEGFTVLSGAFGGSKDGAQGIDYALVVDGKPRRFDVYAMHAGTVRLGTAPIWGHYAAVRMHMLGVWFETVYAHLSGQLVHLDGCRIREGDRIGVSGESGCSLGPTRLHIELHRRRYGIVGPIVREDPYGVYNCVSSGHYPQPGTLLDGVPHFWATNDPPLVERKVIKLRRGPPALPRLA